MRLGKYQLLRKLATGGMAEVFLAKTDGPMGFEKLLVIKRILPDLAGDPQFVEMFLGEAKLAAQLNHPNLVTLFDFGQAGSSYFIAMEYIDGPTLRLLLARSRDLQISIPLPLAARIVSSAAEGLAYAHDFRDHLTREPLHLIHRDVSPDNILIGRSGAVKLVDFGIAKARGQSHHTQVGTVKGKVAYMAPEQLRGDPLDRRVDLYALGVVLYELCTGRMPFEADSDASMVRAVLHDAAIPAVRRVPTLPRALQGILDRLLAKDREARYPDCRTLHADLEAFIQASGEPATGFALSRLVAQLVSAELLTQPAPTNPILASEPGAGPAGAVQPAPLEILGLERTVRADARSSLPLPMAAIEPQRSDRTRGAPSSSAFVFPTALGEERGPAAPVRLGLERHELRRTTSRTVPRVRAGGGALRVLGLLALFVALAAVGAYLGLAAAHRTDLLARVGLPVPGALSPASGPVGASGATAPPGSASATSGNSTASPSVVAGPAPSPAGAPQSETPDRLPGLPAAAATPGAPRSGGRGVSPPPSSGEAQAPNSPTASGERPSTPSATPTGSEAPSPPEAPANGAAPTTAGAPSSGTPGEPSAVGSAGTGEAPARAAAPDENGTGTAGKSGLARAEGASGAAPGEPPTTPAAGTAPTETSAPGTGSAARSGTGLGPATASAPSKPGAPTRSGRRESDREKLLGAFAAVEAAKESTVRLESTPRLQVRMGGKIIGTTPVTLDGVPAGPLELEFFDTGQGLSRPETLVLKPGDNGTHTVVIPKGRLELKLQAGVAVTIDGKSVGRTPLGPVSLYQGRHAVQLTRGEQRERRTVEIRGEQTEVLEYNFPEAE